MLNEMRIKQTHRKETKEIPNFQDNPTGGPISGPKCGAGGTGQGSVRAHRGGALLHVHPLPGGGGAAGRGGGARHGRLRPGRTFNRHLRAFAALSLTTIAVSSAITTVIDIRDQ